MDELLVVGAFLWNQVGKRPTTHEVLAGALSFELRWFNPKDSKSIVALLVSSGLFHEEGDQLTATSKLSDVEIPRGFHPSEDLLEKTSSAQTPALLDAIFHAVREAHAGNVPDLLDETKRTAAELGVSVEGAALLVAWRRGVRKSELLQQFESSLARVRPNDET